MWHVCATRLSTKTTMTQRLDPEYNKMLSTPALSVAMCLPHSPSAHKPGHSLEGPRKEMIDSIQKQIDFYIGEAIRLRCTQNTHLAISRLPAELLSDVFLYLVEDGLQSDSARFAPRTFCFLQVCRHWNEIAVGFPQLWVWWVTGAAKAWPLFKSRSKDAPVFLTWRPPHYYYSRHPTQDVMKDAETPRRIRELDFSDGPTPLEHLLTAIDSSTISVTSSIRLYGISDVENEEHLTRFFSLPFPKLLKVNIEGFLPDPSSSIFTTPNLTSLKLGSPNHRRRYTRSEFLQVLQHHPNLRELELKERALPPVETSRPVPVLLPRLVGLGLYSTDSAEVAGVVDLISMSSPLHNVVIHLQTISPTLISTVGRILTAYYECQGLDYPRKANGLTISSTSLGNDISFDATSPSTPASHPESKFRLQFRGMRSMFFEEIVPIFPLEHARQFTVVKLHLTAGVWRMMLQKMKGLSLLRLEGVDVGLMLNALDPEGGGVYREATGTIFNHSRVHS